MNGRSKYLVKNVGILAISNFASKFLSFFLVPLYTSVLSTEEVGIYDLVVSSVSLAFPMLSLNIVDALMRFLMDKSKNKKEVTSTCAMIVSFGMLPVFLFLLAASKIEWFGSIHGFEIYIFAYYIIISINQFLIQFAKGIEEVAAMGISGILGTVTVLCLNVLFLLMLKMGLEGFFLANIIGQTVPVIYLIRKTKLRNYLSIRWINKSLKKEMLLYCLPLIATAVGWWVNSAADKYVVAFFCGVAANGVLSVAYKIPAIINTLESVFIQAWQISAIKEYGGKGAPQFYGNAFTALNTMMSMACSWLIILAKPLGSLLYQKEFYIAWKYVPFLLLSVVLNAASGFLGPILSAKKASGPMAMSAVYGTIVNVVLNLLLVYLIGIQGAAIATVISSLVIYLVRKNAVGNDIMIDGYGMVLVTWFLLCVQAVLEIYSPFWWAEIIIMIMMLAINRSGIDSLFRMIKSIMKPVQS